MLAANTAVAEELVSLDLPGLFRNHDDPKPSDLAALLTGSGRPWGTGAGAAATARR